MVKNPDFLCQRKPAPRAEGERDRLLAATLHVGDVGRAVAWYTEHFCCDVVGQSDDVATLAELFRHLTRLRARPYYLHQCDLSPGTAGFRVPLDDALAIVGELRGAVSGLSLPTFVIDTPGGLGKVALAPSPILDEDASSVTLRGSLGGEARYPRR